MSRELTVGKRYAKALFELAQERNLVEAIEGELEAVTPLLTDNETGWFFQNPSIGINQKQDVLTRSLSGNVSEELLHTLQLLVRNRRTDVLSSLTLHYLKLTDELRGRATAIVYTPMPLSGTDSDKIADYFGELTGKQIRIKNEIRPDLLGGMQVRIGDRLYDASLSGKLTELKKLLA